MVMEATGSKQCPFCTSAYKFQSSLNKHMRKKHPDESKENQEERISCHICFMK